ncbi:hypothetical protein KIM67_07040 [Flagellimonas sp. 389]|uniref:hypothetical protein n=1 Tax=Flagellimonas sp. 389 TaxID=2835862 RepID=UPI001BD5CCD3|nr:hypothetical protein [Flagellimonas sp. 389]MBS9462160.1 hypothetical protein [Flagellimonas sp. 389]
MKNTYSLSNGKVYLVKTADECVSDELIKKMNNSYQKVLIINSLSKSFSPIFLPIYKAEKKKILKQSGINSKINPTDSKFLKFILDEEIVNYDIIFFGLTALHYEGISFLEKYSLDLVYKMGKTIVLIDYNTDYDVTSIDLLT